MGPPEALVLLPHPNPSPLSVERNTITNNTVAGVYVYNFGAGEAASTTDYNSIAGNTIVGADGTTNPNPSTYYYIGQYGVLLFNSSGNIPGVPLFGAYENATTSTTLAPFREYTGPGPNTILTVPSAGSSAVEAESVSLVKAASASHPVIVNAGGKGHPRPPASKNHARKS